MTAQRERVLRALRRAGPTGITQVAFLGPVTVDGGPPITRLAARVGDLRGEGHQIVQAGRRDKCVVYVLRGAVAAPPVVVTPAVEPELSLFDPASTNVPASPYDGIEDAA